MRPIGRGRSRGMPHALAVDIRSQKEQSHQQRAERLPQISHGVARSWLSADCWGQIACNATVVVTVFSRTYFIWILLLLRHWTGARNVPGVMPKSRCASTLLRQRSGLLR